MILSWSSLLSEIELSKSQEKEHKKCYKLDLINDKMTKRRLIEFQKINVNYVSYGKCMDCKADDRHEENI